MIPELQSADHFEPISLWDAAWAFPIFAPDRFEQPRDDGAISVAASRCAQAETTVWWAKQLLQAVGKDRISGNPYHEGFTYTSKFRGARGYADWCFLPFEMAQCLRNAPPAESDFDYSDPKFLSRGLALALPIENRELKPIYEPVCSEFELQPFLEQLQQSKP